MTQELLQHGLALHQAGRLDEARDVYRQILQVDQNSAAAWHLMGLLLHQQGHADQAVSTIEQAVRLDDRNPTFLGNLGGVLMSVSRFTEAEAALRRGLELAPADVSLLNNLGVVLLEQEQPEDAVRLFEQVVAQSPQHAQAQMNLGNTHRAMGRPEQAIECYERARAAAPDSVEVLTNLGGVQLNLGQLDVARVTLSRAVELSPGCSEAVCNLASLLTRCEDSDAAILVCEQAIAANERLPAIHARLGELLARRGEPARAEQHLRTAVTLDSRQTDAMYQLGLMMMKQERQAEAVALLDELVRNQPDHVDAWNQLGLTCESLGDLDQATHCFRAALDHDSDCVPALNNLGNTLSVLGQLQAGMDCFHKALALQPDSADGHNNLGCTLMMLGRADQALVSLRKAAQLGGLASQHSVALLCEQYQPDVTAARLLESHRSWQLHHAGELPTFPVRAIDSEPPERMRLGFVSPDLGTHPVGYFLSSCLQHLDREAFEVVCYSDRRNEDAMTARIRESSDGWQPVRALSNNDLSERIHSDRIDILFDLAGHTAHNRLPVFARRPAPIQATWMGYVGTTGLDAMDFVIADRFHIPAGEDDCYTESVYRMPHGYICFTPPDDVPDVGDLPALRSKRITFGCLGNPCKITAQVIEVWSEVLRATPDSRLLLKYIGMDDPCVRENIGELFRTFGVDPDRIEFLGRSPHREFLDTWNRIDIGLDTFPYSSGLTVCESLLMGVPMVTCPGQSFAGRHASGHQSNIGLNEVITSDHKDYIATAVRLANDIPRLAELRSTLRTRLLESPLCDYPQFAASFETACRDMWTSKARAQNRQNSSVDQ